VPQDHELVNILTGDPDLQVEQDCANSWRRRSSNSSPVNISTSLRYRRLWLGDQQVQNDGETVSIPEVALLVLVGVERSCEDGK
jgi:hypothetical protein